MSLLLLFQSAAEATDGAGAPSIDAPAVAGTGAETFAGSGAVAIGAPGVAGSGSETASATGGVSIAAPGVSGTGSEGVSGSGGVSIDAPALAGTGTHTAATSGDPCAFDPDAFDPDAFDTCPVTTQPHHPGGPPMRAARVTGPAGRRRRVIRGKGGIIIKAPSVAGIGSHNDDELALLALLTAY